MDDEEARTIGRRLRNIRTARGKSLTVIAGLAGISPGHLSKLETGERALTRLATMVALAEALEISPTELTKLPVPAPGNGHTDSNIEMLRRALSAVDYGLPGGLVVPVDVLRERILQLRAARRSCRFADVGAELPSLIRDVHTTLASGRQAAEILLLAVVLHVHVTQMWLRDAGAPADLRDRAALLARSLAEQHGGVSVIALAAEGSVRTLRSSGNFALARSVLDAVETPPVTQETAGVVGIMLENHANVAAVDNRPADAEAALSEAEDIANRFGEQPEDDAFYAGFGPVAIGLRQDGARSRVG